MISQVSPRRRYVSKPLKPSILSKNLPMNTQTCPCSRKSSLLSNKSFRKVYSIENPEFYSFSNSSSYFSSFNGEEKRQIMKGHLKESTGREKFYNFDKKDNIILKNIQGQRMNVNDPFRITKLFNNKPNRFSQLR